MKNTLSKMTVLLFVILSTFISNSQPIPGDSLYLGQTPPDHLPQKFQLPVSSGLFLAERIAISPDEKEIYYSELDNYPPSTMRIKYFRYSVNKWNGPFTLFDGYMAPGLTLSGDTMFIEKLHSGSSTPYTYISLRNDTAWTAPIKFMPDNQSYKHYLQITNSGNYYLSSNPPGSIGGLDWCKLVVDNTDTTIQTLGNLLNTSSNDADFHIARDEAYMIISTFPASNRHCNGYLDLFITYKKADGTWTNPKNMGTTINVINPSDGRWGPYVTIDNKYLFYSRGITPADGCINWIRIDNLIDSLKRTNFVPYVKYSIPNQQATKDLMFNYQIPDSTFLDDDGNKTLTYNATLINGNPLPAWLSFDPTTRTFSGFSSTLTAYSIKVIAKDTANETASTTFNITVALPSIDYFGQIPPGDSARLFSTGTVSLLDRPEHAGIFSRDGKEFYFCVSTMNWNTFNTYVKKFVDGNWTTETIAPFSSISGGAAETFINKQNTRIIFVSKGTGFTSDGWIKTDFWTVERKGDSLGNPVKLSPAINDIEVQWHPSVSDSGHIYFGSKGSVYMADCMNDTTFGLPVKLNDPNINFTGSKNADVCVARDESYLIFSSNRPGGYGGNDLYISYKKKDNTWGTSVNLGSKINSGSADFSPGLTPDGKYLLFSRDDGSTRHIYWVSSSFIDSIRQIVTGVSQENVNIPKENCLYQNYPNPFNPTTTIRYFLDKSSQVKLTIYNLLGQKIKTIKNAFQNAGEYSIVWDATDNKNNPVSSGMYFYRLETDRNIIQKKMMLVK